MTERLYYLDSYCARFTAHVTERASHAGRPALALDRTCFYPTSGGQPHDRGTINGVPVVDVVVREADGAVLHVMAGEVPGDAVEGEIDWARRFDHMQHHTGQHILTRAFIEVAGARTVSFHLGEESVTIDLDRTPLPPEQIDAAEDLANRVVFQDVAVRAWFPSEAELEELTLRKVPEVEGRLRVVAVGDFDTTACGGTHVARTGEVGLIKVIRTEKYKDMTRVEFRCGGRALRDYRHKNAIVNRLAAELTVGYWELEEALARLRAENKALRGDLKAARQALLEAEAQALWQEAPAQDGVRVITLAWEAGGRDPGEARQLAGSLVRRPGTVALLGLDGEKAQLILARSQDLPALDMVAVLEQAMAVLSPATGAGRGGGRPDFAQGGGGQADAGQVQAALEAARRAVLAAVR